MDKITRIHLAKIPYEIDVSAEIELKKYFDEIRSELDTDLADDIMTDVEVRVTEILSERNVKRNDVITIKDIDAVQEQLGSPEQFTDGESKTNKKDSSKHETKKLFRDLDGAYIGGVASGLGAYFSIDPIFIRLLFILLVFASGLGVLLYLLLWLLVPPAKTNSDKLQMRGEPVTAATLQRSRSAAARTITNVRVQKTLKAFHLAFKIIFTVGVALFVLGLLSSIGFGSALLYTQPLHPLYTTYHLNYVLVGLIWLFTMTIVGLLIIMLLRVWRKRSPTLKITFISLASLLILTLAGGAVVSPFVVSHYKNLYGGNNLTVALPVQNDTPVTTPTSLNLSSSSDNLVVSYVANSQPLHATYKAYPGMGRPQISIVSKDGNVNIQTKQLSKVVPNCVLDWCHNIYLPVKVTVYGPAIQKFTVNGETELDVYNDAQNNLTLVAQNNANITILNSYSNDLILNAQSGSNIDASGSSAQTSTITIQNNSYVFGPASNTLSANIPTNCNPILLELSQLPSSIKLNGQSIDSQNFSNNTCVSVDDLSPPNAPVPNESLPFMPDSHRVIHVHKSVR